MELKYFTAARIHNGVHFESESKVLVFTDDGVLKDIVAINEVDPILITELPGTLCPGFVNTHCHLELSHTQGNIPEHTGLVPFLGAVVQARNKTTVDKVTAITEAFDSLANAGCIAVGDIANSTDTLEARKTARFHIHTFVEAMGFVPAGASARFTAAENVLVDFKRNDCNSNGYALRQSIVPHAPYSVSPALFEQIDQFEPESLISIHNEECAAENQYFIDKTGEMQALYAVLGINDDWFLPTGRNSLPSYLPYLSSSHPLVLVHNTFMDDSDITLLQKRNAQVSLCLCPNANLYIENRLPNIPLLAASGLNICLGTDSLASNHQLDVYAEIQTLSNHFPEIQDEILLAWATSGGAKALQLNHIIGHFKPEYKPGLVHIHDDKAQRLL